MTVEITDVADTAPRRAIASFDPYEDAQALLDRLADGGFPVERLAIEGQELELTGRSMVQLAAHSSFRRRGPITVRIRIAKATGPHRRSFAPAAHTLTLMRTSVSRLR